MNDAERTEWMENIGKLPLAMDELAKDYERMGRALQVRGIQEMRLTIAAWASTGEVDTENDE